MPKITPEIRQALSFLIESEGSALEVSRKTNISHSTISKYLSGQIQKINQANWRLLEPLLLPFLPALGKENEIDLSRNSAIPPDVLLAILNNKTMSAADKAECITMLIGKLGKCQK